MRSCKFLKSYLLIPLYFFVAPAFGQQPSFYGSKNPYHYSGHDTIQPPAGYHAFFINYAGRHGARHLTNLKEISLLDEFMTYAGDSGGLTGEGRKLQHMIHILLEVEKKYTPGTLSMLGSEEQSGLGKRMAKRYPMIISNANSCITIVSTKEKRTVQSAESFMNGLLSGYKDKYRCIHKMPADSIHLRFFSLSPAYKDFLKNGNWKDKAKELDTAATSKMVNKDIIERFFSTAFINKQQSEKFDKISNAKNFSAALYAAGAIVPGIIKEIENFGYKMSDVNIFSLLTKSELQNLSLVDGAKDFLVKGPGTNADGIQVRNALPLLADFIKTSDNAVQNHESGAWLRFAHAETIAPLATFMELSGAAEADTSIFNYNQVWNVSNIMGYSRNIQWIFYKKTNSNRDDDIRLKILLNEIPVHIPVATTEFPYYNWSEVRRFYITKIKDHGVNLTDNMYQYLLGLN